MYRLTQFGTTTLEYYNQMDDVGSGATPTQYLSLPEGGALDEFGSQQKHPGVIEYTKTVRLRATSESALTDLFLNLRALRGKRDRLYRKTAQNNTHWQYARLVEVSAKRDYANARFKRFQDVDLRFATQEVFWRGTAVGRFLDTGNVLDSGAFLDTGLSQSITSNPTNFNVTCGTASDPGRAPVKAMTLTINPGNATMSNIIIQRTGGEKLTYAGTLAANELLVIDTGALQVSRGGVDAYSGMVFQPAADMAAWFTLQPGVNALSVSYTGGGTGRTIRLDYYEAWY